MKNETVQVGDKIRFSLEFINAVKEMPEQRTQLCKVLEISEGDHGEKILTMAVFSE
jgi:hypothetical protein